MIADATEPFGSPLPPDDLSSRVGHEIRRQRHAAGLSINTVSRASGVSVAAISKFERGLVSPQLETYVVICEALSIDPSEVLRSARIGLAAVAVQAVNAAVG